jgi:ketosteroid isomerase-like protein
MPGNAAIVRRGYEAFNRGDLTTLAELFGDNVSWHTPGWSPLAGYVVGRLLLHRLRVRERPDRGRPRALL